MKPCIAPPEVGRSLLQEPLCQYNSAHKDTALTNIDKHGFCL